MNDLLFVKIGQCAKQIVHDLDCVALLVQALALDALKQFPTLKVRQQQVDVLLGLVYLVKLNNILVLHLPKNVNFVENRLYVATRLLKHGLLNCLQRVLLLLVALSFAHVHLCKVAAP